MKDGWPFLPITGKFAARPLQRATQRDLECPSGHRTSRELAPLDQGATDLGNFWRCRAMAGVKFTEMMLVLWLLAVGSVTAIPTEDDEARFALPDDLLVGAGVAAIQTEGAWNEGGKSPSVWDVAFHSGNLIPLGYATNLHDKAADSYHRFREDLDAAVQMKVTMYHFDHPQILEDEFKGWLDRRMVAKFGEYAAFVLKEYGSKVKLWTTVNEPNIYCSFLEGLIETGRGEPLNATDTVNVYPCLHYFLLAHGQAYRAFRDGNFEGKIGFTVTTLLSRPTSTSPEDVYASESFNQMFAGMLLHPLVYGDYPQIVKNIAGDKLLKFTDDEKEMLKNSTDYIGLNVYYGMAVQYKDPATPRRNIRVPLLQLFKEANFLEVGYRSPTGESLEEYPLPMIAPDAMRSALLWTWFTYKLPIMITENGIGYQDMLGVHDHQRAVYHSAFMRAMVSTIHDFGTKIMGYSAWSLIDSYEWQWGFSRDFGLVHVDYEHGSLNRTLKDSASFWVELAERRVVPLVVPSSSPFNRVSPALLLALAFARAVSDI
ncbi:cyanidin 3-O-glucoside 7-O-glucosyltransferase (acyl-glucose)-like isoform X2 [Thrips palmi]|uniref:Cyanidin 3-O-glucoside 7-O-glucosyltransferase (Acyl-glucose)-like isoform X2 n=1 Tax=Thrips palmi TaxID=161013 RepID=A0A6P9A377_THRPL|nr:cyanidin 3-O-glucoside 7-O-glucosyltransferase (acyl-glucose)-like isoform X2 [Thrips palmi]